jgi:polyprenyl-phospho-N-acetylgalactosaminyl synthase
MPVSDLQIVGAKTFVVVPAYNEGEVIRDVLSGLCSVFQNVVVVNDGSSDGTVALLQDLPVITITHAVNLGQGAALQTGITYSLEQGADFVVTFDADGQHRVEDAVAVLREVQSGRCDAACGSRFLGATVNMPYGRKVLIKAAVWFSNIFTKTRLTDAHNGLRALNRKAASHLAIFQSGMAHASEIVAQLSDDGLRLREVPVQITYTEYSLAKGQSTLNAVNVLVDLVVGKLLK